MLNSMTDVAIGFVCVLIVALFMCFAPAPKKVCRLPEAIHCTGGAHEIVTDGRVVGCQR